MPGLSAVIVARDERQDVGRAIGAVSFADEVLLVDAGWSDAMPARSPPAVRMVKLPFEGDGPTWRRAVAEAENDWVLCLGADEEVTRELAGAIQALLAAGQPPDAGYRLRLVTAFMGRPLTHGAAWNADPIRLFDRRRARWSSAPVLAEVEPGGSVGWLPGRVLHHAPRDLSDSIARMDAESSLAAIHLAMGGRRPGGLTVVLAAGIEFLRHYLVKQGFRNGFPGLAWSFMKGVESAMTYMKARELVAGTAWDPGPLEAEPARPLDADRPPGGA